MHRQPHTEPIPEATEAPSATFGKLPEEKRRRVLEESLREFSEQGYHRASVNRIVARLDIAKGSLFQYFGSKEGLFRHLFRLAVEEIKAPLKAIRDASEPLGFAGRLRRLFAEASAFAAAHPLVWGVYRRMLAQEDFPLRERLLSELRAEALCFFRELVEGGQDRGELRRDLNAAAAAFVIEAALDRALAAQASPLLDAGLGLAADAAARARRLEDIVDTLCRGFAAGGAQGDRNG